MPEDIPEPSPEASELEHPSHEPIVHAYGNPVSRHMVVLVTLILFIVVAAAAIFAFSQGVFAHPASYY